MLPQFGMADYNATKFPMEPGAKLHNDKEGQLVEENDGLLEVFAQTRPDLSYSVGVANRFMEKPAVMHCKGAKQIL